LYRATIGARPPLTANSSAADLARRADAALAAAAAATTTTKVGSTIGRTIYM
jgi:hypothetical protein